MMTYSLVVLLSQFWTKVPRRRERLPTPVIWPGEFHGLQSMGLPRVRHDWASFTFTFTFLVPCLVCMLSFHFIYGFLCSERLRSLIRSHLFIFAFICIVLRDWPKKTLIQFVSENVLPVFSSRSFMVSCLIVYFFKPFWGYFCVWCESVFWLQWFVCCCPTFPTLLAEGIVFSPLCVLDSFAVD